MKVSIGVIALNEEKYLPSILEDILKQDYPHDKMEILLVDSMSNDQTLDIMNDFKITYKNTFWNIEVLKNEKKRQANGWNVILKNFRGDVIIRIDAHAHVPIDFVKKNMNCLRNGEFVCGGRRPSIIEKSTWGNEILLEAESAMFGSGISSFRNSKKSQYVKSIFHGAYCREVFETVGYFNEKLGRTEDNDIHQRIREAGYNIFMDKDIISYQYVRPTLRKMLIQKFLNGFWIGKTTFINHKCLSFYYYIPAMFVLACIFASIGILTGNLLMGEILGTLYVGVLLMIGIISVCNNKLKLKFLIVPLLCFLIHVSYGFGTLYGLLLGKNGKGN